MSDPKRLAWLFDVDGTLLLTEGAAHEAFVHAVRDRLRVEDDLPDVPFHGRTEPLILADILRKHGATFVDGDEAHFWNSVFDHMHRVFHPGRGRLMPGVLALLDAIDREPAWGMGLLTGNMTQMARIKLQRFGIAERFAFGAFGEEAGDRNALACVAVSRVAAQFGVPPERCIVIGDTEHDIRCARAAGARAVAVATGPSDCAALAAFGPDLVLEDLSDTSRVMEWAREIASA